MVIKSLSFDELDPRDQNFFWTEERAHELMQEFGLTALGWKFKWDRAAVRLGQCNHTQKTIAFSQHYDHIEREEIEDTLLHEIAHALVGPQHGHDWVWRAKCVEIGARPERCAPDHVETGKNYNFVIKCDSCTRKYYRFRVARRFYNAECRCGGTLKVYKLVRKG